MIFFVPDQNALEVKKIPGLRGQRSIEETLLSWFLPGAAKEKKILPEPGLWHSYCFPAARPCQASLGRGFDEEVLTPSGQIMRRGLPRVRNPA